MIIGRIHDDLSLVAAREKLCAHARSVGSPCHGTLLPAVYRAALTHSGNISHRPPVDFSHDAILYVTVIVVFYAAIIALLVGTNLRRRRNRPTITAPPQQQQVTFDERSGAARVESLNKELAAETPPDITSV
ncbi:uncharacterized protein LOC132193265 [Neocloeon triangulifer]|uniref:uncharacterized protein LOC132193265 n=1 Tax=Neocloeon triangulifer TaxID=2078957 RepID=UPI00286F1133|nr:uncharacterized protein LOC132193265 [Neocloeon triangulifer]XP_059469826.1 uncharacterized protein LOC132193265 [Neocloeon triangulifer]